MTTASAILSSLLISTYTAAVCIKGKGVSYSISETFYKIDHKLWFGATMVLTACLLMPAILEITPDSYQFTAFLACVGLIMVGVAPNFREGIDREIHTIGAVLCLVFSQMWVGLTLPWMLLLWVGYLAYTAIGLWRNWTGYFTASFLATKPMFWVEISSLLSTYVTIILTKI
ncbi:glycosyl transferase [Phocaeicola barnesiae]|uniref:glycosyl transferase n=1 Tax=Phocaeicola barnesiae TaxID=376804 RepID=UPI001F1F91CE|nr:glycosyl transferase [Phocaeicola barnesiae]MCF2599634.1 glycosyl transferase [Phocaeicola barnesiae]